jgi:Tol biopolymer transport system component/DNA-binding winged helix-turn-helix (wHTH) protein
VEERELRRDVEVVALTAKTFDLLLILVQGAGRTFTKSELLESLWPETSVEESSLSQTIFLLRKALGENGDGSEYILTVPRRGYKFIGSVSRHDPAGNGAGPENVRAMRSRPSLLWPSIAVLALVALAALAFVHFRDAVPETRQVRSTILPPEKTSFYLFLALSPDGRRIVFAATAENGKRQLWIRPLDAETAQPLDGTEGAVQPFWSPDSRWVAFFADGMLKKIDTQGGPPIALADAPVPFGGSWSPNGVILFSPNWDALQKISPAGGKATPAVDAAVGYPQCCPWFLPDGDHYVFAVQVRGDSQAKLLVGSLRSTSTKVVGEASIAMYAQGQLLYLRESILMAQPFDVKALRMTGEAMRIAGPVRRSLGPFPAGVFSVSSTGLLAYQGPAGASGLQLTWFDRTGKALGTVGAPRVFYDIELSPDRKRLAATATDVTGNVDVWTYDSARGSPTRFTFDPAPEFRAMWSPDGRSIVFNSGRKGHEDLYRKSADGAGVEDLLYADTREKYPVSWSRDGKFLLYDAFGGSQGSEPWALPLTPEQRGAPLKPQPFLETKFKTFGQFSPDSRWVAYESDESQPPEIYVAPFSRPTEKHQISPNGGARPRWRQDGKEIFYLTPGGQLMAAEVGIQGDTLEVGAVRELFSGIPLGAGYFYDVSADGQRVLAAVRMAATQKDSEPITLVQNWATALKR